MGSRPRTAAAWSEPTSSPPTAPSSPARASALSGQCQEGRQDLGGRQPGQHQRFIAMNNAPDLDPPVHRHDPPRPQPGHGPVGRQDLGTTVNDITKMTIWGNHSATQYPDLFHGRSTAAMPLRRWAIRIGSENTFIPTVQSAARPSSRPGAPPRRRQRQRCGRSRSHLRPGPRTVTGFPWPCRPTAATASPRDS